IVMICFYARAMRAVSVGFFILLLLAAPLVGIPISAFGTPLFEINFARLLSIVLLLPLLSHTVASGRSNAAFYRMPDGLIVCYVLLRIALESENGTQAMRSAIVLSLDVLIPYFAFSRAVTGVADLHRILLAFILTVLPLSLIAIFESGKGWLLYGSV